jgi:hypothetical protein
MNLFQRIFASKTSNVQKPFEQSVIVNFQYNKPDLIAFFELSDRLKAAIETAGVGEYDGNEIDTDGSDAFLFMVGPDGDKLFAVVRPILKDSDLMKEAVVTIHYGTKLSDARKVEL